MNETDFVKQLPEAFYRVSVKCLIRDEQDRLLVACDNLGSWEIPGGGWTSGESLEACARREVFEEYGVEADTVGDVQFVYQNQSDEGYYKLCIVVPVTIRSYDFRHENDDLVESRFVGREEFMQLPFHFNERAIIEYVDQIWHSVP